MIRVVFVHAIIMTTESLELVQGQIVSPNVIQTNLKMGPHRTQMLFIFDFTAPALSPIKGEAH